MDQLNRNELQVVSFGGSYLGRRKNNEDSLGRTIPKDQQVLRDKGRLYIVSDGMGGVNGGEVASRMAVEIVMDCYYALSGPAEECLRSAIRQASAMIVARAREEAGLENMGATIIAAAVLQDRLIFAHVGDSRLYLCREGSLHRMTRDHLHILDSLGVSEAEADTHPQRNILSRALGYPEACNPECSLLEFHSEDRLLLCTDGLSDCISPELILAALQSRTPKEAVNALMSSAERLKSKDNATSLVIYFNSEKRQDPPTVRIPFPEMTMSPA